MYCSDQISSDIVLLDTSWNTKFINQNPGKYNNYLVNNNMHHNNVPTTIINEPLEFPSTSSSIEKFHENNFLMHHHHHHHENDGIINMDNENGTDFLMLMNNSSINNSPKDGSDSGIESDYTDGNLSWLLNYKIRELPPVPDSAIAENELNNYSLNHHHHQNGNSETVVVEERFNNNLSNKQGNIHQKIQSNNPQRKPPFTYTELIEHALTEKSELTVSGIYNWISYHFPFYKANDDRWKNSVRHNLSINPHFRKGGKAVHGAGHLWTIAQRDETKSWQMRQRINDFLKMNSQHLNKPNASTFEADENFDKELQAATESILEIQPQETDVQQQIKENAEINEDVHVEFINMPDGVVTGLEGFLSPPVSKQQIVDECGLGNDFFITNINPSQLGLNLVETEMNDYDEMSLEYYGIKE